MYRSPALVAFVMDILKIFTSQRCHAAVRSDKTWEEKKARLTRYQQKTTTERQTGKISTVVPEGQGCRRVCKTGGLGC